MRTRTLTPGITPPFCTLCAASRTIAQGYAERCLAISEQHGFRQWLGLSRAIRGICAATLDASGRRLDEVKAALDEYQRAGYQLGVTVQLVLLCPALLLRDESEAALEVVDHGLSIVSQNSERFFEAELYRLKARVLRMRGASDAEAESLLDQALRTARSQQARSLELRAATDLARLWMKQGKRDEARDVLGSVHGRFSEGFDTRDLKEASARAGPAAVMLLARLQFGLLTLSPSSRRQLDTGGRDFVVLQIVGYHQ